MHRAFKKSQHLESNFELQITALVDTLVIILIFLLKSISMDTLELDQAKGLVIPSVNQGVGTGKGDKISVLKEGILWDTETAVELENFQAKNTSEEQWKALEVKLRAIEKKETTVFLQADKAAPLSLVNRTLRALTQSGYKNVRFVGARYN